MRAPLLLETVDRLKSNRRSSYGRSSRKRKAHVMCNYAFGVFQSLPSYRPPCSQYRSCTAHLCLSWQAHQPPRPKIRLTPRKNCRGPSEGISAHEPRQRMVQQRPSYNALLRHLPSEEIQASVHDLHQPVETRVRS